MVFQASNRSGGGADDGLSGAGQGVLRVDFEAGIDLEAQRKGAIGAREGV